MRKMQRTQGQGAVTAKLVERNIGDRGRANGASRDRGALDYLGGSVEEVVGLEVGDGPSHCKLRVGGFVAYGAIGKDVVCRDAIGASGVVCYGA